MSGRPGLTEYSASVVMDRAYLLHSVGRYHEALALFEAAGYLDYANYAPLRFAACPPIKARAGAGGFYYANLCDSRPLLKAPPSPSPK